MSERFAVPIMGVVPSLEFALVESVSNPPNLMVTSWASFKRFAVQIVDDGLASAGLMPGDYAIFSEQRWPNDECQVCIVAFGDDVSLRVIEDIFNTEPILRIPDDRITPERRHRNDFIVQGVLVGAVKAGLEVIQDAPVEEFDWGC